MSCLNDIILPGSTIGIIGGGQLGQMLALDAKQKGFYVVVLDPDDNCSAGQVSDCLINADYNDLNALTELAQMSDVITYEFENVDLESLKRISENTNLPQGTNLLYITKNRYREKTFLQKQKIATAKFQLVNNEQELADALTHIGYPCVLKTNEGGYDGKGQVVLKEPKDLSNVKQILQQPCILEEWIPFKSECSVMVARNKNNDITIFPISDNYHQNEILRRCLIPAAVSQSVMDKIQKIAKKLALSFKLEGILGIELFIGTNDEVYVNELAPRPHNSGHYSIEACDFSQFDLHNRAICNWPLPNVSLLKPAIMLNVLGQHCESIEKLIRNHPDWHFHDYVKGEARYNRKMGHITILTNDINKTLNEIQKNKILED